MYHLYLHIYCLFKRIPQWISSILDTPDASGPRYMWFPTKTHGFRSGSLKWSTVNFMTYPPITNVAGKSQTWKVITGKNHWVIYMSLGFHSHVWFPMNLQGNYRVYLRQSAMCDIQLLQLWEEAQSPARPMIFQALELFSDRNELHRSLSKLQNEQIFTLKLGIPNI